MDACLYCHKLTGDTLSGYVSKIQTPPDDFGPKFHRQMMKVFPSSYFGKRNLAVQLCIVQNFVLLFLQYHPVFLVVNDQ